MGFLSTKINNKQYAKGDFPRSPKTETVITFLEEQGFKLIDYIPLKNRTYEPVVKLIYDLAKDSDENSFMSGESLFDKNKVWVRFWKGGEINKENPIFFCVTHKDGTKPKDPCWLETKDTSNAIKIEDFNEFVAKANSYFEF